MQHCSDHNHTYPGGVDSEDSWWGVAARRCSRCTAHDLCEERAHRRAEPHIRCQRRGALPTPLHASGFSLGRELGLAARSHEQAVHHVLAVAMWHACVCSIVVFSRRTRHSKGFIGNFQHSGGRRGRDFDHPRHSHYSGVIPMVFQHSRERDFDHPRHSRPLRGYMYPYGVST